jgi:hypothetical protein
MVVLVGGGGASPRAARGHHLAPIFRQIVEEQVLMVKMGLGVDSLESAHAALRAAAAARPVEELLDYLKSVGADIEAGIGAPSEKPSTPSSSDRVHSSPESKESQQLYQALSSMPLMENVSPEEFQQLMQVLRTVQYEDGEEIMVQGDEGDCMYILKQGRAFAEIEGVGRVMDYEPGRYFGEVALKSKAPRAATVKAEGDAVLARLGTSVLDLLPHPTRSLSQARASRLALAAAVQSALPSREPHASSCLPACRGGGLQAPLSSGGW